MPTGNNGQNALNIYINNGSDKDKLMQVYADVVDFVQKTALSVRLKNNNFEGEAMRGGSVIVRRLRTAISKAYGTARTAGEGDPLINDGVEVKLDIDREIVEELERKDIDRYGIANLMQKRAVNHRAAMVRELDRAFFVAAQTAGATVDLSSASTLQDKVEMLIQNLETATGDHVDGVDREDMVLTVTPFWFGKLQNYIDTLPNPNGGGVAINRFHGVEIVSSPRQDVDAILMYRGAVAQPVAVDAYQSEKINLSNAFAVELFYSFGTKAVMPDLIRKAGFDGNISA